MAGEHCTEIASGKLVFQEQFCAINNAAAAACSFGTIKTHLQTPSLFDYLQTTAAVI